LSELDPVDFEARPADLDELFLSYYRDIDESESATGKEASHVA
jgi:hypothetical protein